MMRIDGRRRAARLVLTAGLAAAAAVTGAGGTALAGPPAVPPAVPPVGTILDAGGPGAIAGSYIVTLRPGAEAARVTATSRQLAQRYGGTVLDTYVTTLRGFHLEATAGQAARLAADPAVLRVEQDAEVTLSATRTDPVWGLDRVDQRALPLSRSYTSRSAAGVTAYVLDTGIRTTHREFGGRARSGWDFVDDDSTAQDCNGHGTHVAGTVGGATYGVATDVRLVGVRVLNCAGSGSYSAIIAGVDWVTRNAVRPAVANMSLGGTASVTLDEAVRRSVAAGVVYAVAAGNDNRDACRQSPARAAEAITVAATDRYDSRASFANYGRCVDLFAPGVQTTSASHRSDTATATMSGTSMAAPHVAGAAALVLGAYPGRDASQVRDALVGNGTANAVTSPGPGSPNRLLSTGFLNTTNTTGRAAPACGASSGTAVRLAANRSVSSARTVTGCAGRASRAARVTVHVRTGYRGSVAVRLIAPDGTARTLKAARRADHGDDVAASWTVDLSSERRGGTWRLRVTDTYGSTGTLRSWVLRL